MSVPAVAAAALAAPVRAVPRAPAVGTATASGVQEYLKDKGASAAPGKEPPGGGRPRMRPVRETAEMVSDAAQAALAKLELGG